MLFSCNLVFVMILVFFFLKEVIIKNNIIVLVFEIIGIIIIIDFLNIKFSVLGVIFIIVLILIFVFYGVFGKKKCVKYGGIVVICFGFIFGSFEMLILIGLIYIILILNWFYLNGFVIFLNIFLFIGYNLNILFIVVFICIINIGVGFVCYFKVMEEIFV